MPKKHENPSSKSHKSSNTRAGSNLAVRQATGTENTRSAPSRTEHNGGGNEVPNASARPGSHSPSNNHTSAPSQGPAKSSASGDSLSKPTLGPSAYIDAYVEYRKRLFIKIFMEKVDEWLDEHVCPLEEAYDCEEGPSGSSKSSGSTKTKSNNSKGKPLAGSKRQLRGDDQDDDHAEDDDDGNRRDRDKKRAKTDAHDDRKRFACPFYKYDPVRYKHHRSCFGPGWIELHRLKEHIFRHHRLFNCSRCFEHFGDDKALQKHVRAANACVLKDESTHKKDPGAGMDQETEKKIKSRKPGKQSDVSRWYEIYRILFPDEVDDIESLPSPWYDDPAGSNGKNALSDSDELKTRYQHFLRRTIPSMVQESLEAEAAEFFNGATSVMQGHLSVWIQNAASRCAKIFEYIPSPTEAASQGDPDAVAAEVPKSREGTPVFGTTDAAGHDPGGDSTLDWPLEMPSLDDLGDLDFSFPLPEDCNSFNPCWLPEYDSAYASGSTGGFS